MAPERLQGNPATPASDLYSAGVLLYEAATGRKPFTGDSPMAVAASIATGRPVAVADLNPAVDGALAAAVQRALATDPADRFGSAREMAAALAQESSATRVFTMPVDAPTEFSSPAPVSTPAPAWLDRVDRSRVGRLLLAGGGVLLLIVLLVAALGHDGGSAGSTTTTLRPSSTTSQTSPTSGGPGSVPDPLGTAIDQLENAVHR